MATQPDHALDQPGATTTPCRHLRHKGMYVYTDGLYNPPQDQSSDIFWCLHSMKGYGPDDQRVDRESCCDSSRRCYEPL